VLIALTGAALGCGSSSAAVGEPVHASLTRPAMPPLAVADALEALIAEGADHAADRRHAYERTKGTGGTSAEDALGRAMVAGRLAQISGLGAPSLLSEIERDARRSAELDPSFRSGAAQRLLGTLYVMAPAAMLAHGDSEAGLELLKGVVERFPGHAPNRLRLAEGYIALGDPAPALPHLCYCASRRAALRRDEQKLLAELIVQVGARDCP